MTLAARDSGSATATRWSAASARGGMADVWLADDSMLDRRVALKFLHERFAQDEQFVERFRREAQAAAGLQHPNVVGVYDRGETDGRHWIAMEYVEGASLKDLIDRGLSVGEAVEIIRQVLAGDQVRARARDRPPRPQAPERARRRARAAPGSRTSGSPAPGPRRSPRPARCSAPRSTSRRSRPRGCETTATSDLYSIGVMLYEALTGRVPFEADSPVAVALKQVSERPGGLRELNPQVPPALDAVVVRALAKDPLHRFQSADEFIAALDAAEVDPSGGAGAARRRSPRRPTEERTPWWKRRWVIALAVLALLLAGVAAFALTRPSTAKVPTVLDDPVEVARAKVRGGRVRVRPAAGSDLQPGQHRHRAGPAGVARRPRRARP